MYLLFISLAAMPKERQERDSRLRTGATTDTTTPEVSANNDLGGFGTASVIGRGTSSGDFFEVSGKIAHLIVMAKNADHASATRIEPRGFALRRVG